MTATMNTGTSGNVLSVEDHFPSPTDGDVNGIATDAELATSAAALTTAIGLKLDKAGGAISGSLTIGTALGVASGGTGVATVAAGSYLKGNGTSALVPRTVAEVQSDLSTSTPGTWLGVAVGVVELGTGMVADVTGTYYPVGFRAARDGTLQGAGRINRATDYTAGAAIVTLFGALIPEKSLSIPYRSGGGGAVAGFIEINGSAAANPGRVSFSSNITVGAGAWFDLTIINARRTVAGT